MEKASQFNDFFKLAKIFYTTIGIQPYEEVGPRRHKAHTLASQLIFYSGLINMNYVLLMEVVYVVLAFVRGQNILEAIMTMSYIGFVLVGDFKMFFVWQQKASLTKFVQGLSDIFPHTLELQTQYKLAKYLRECDIITRGFSSLYIVVIWMYNLYAIVQYLIYEKWLQTREVGQQLPYYTYSFWDWSNHWSYYLLYFLQTLAGYTSAVGQISSDLLLCAFCTQLVMHFDYVAHTVTNYKVKLAIHQSAGEREQAVAQDTKFLKDIIQYHTSLLNLCDQMNDVFSLPLLLNFIANSLVICFVGFQMTIGAEPDTFIKLFLFFFSSIAQLYLVCNHSQILLNASVKVADAVYNQNWSNADVRYQKMLVLMAERAQKPAQLKATTFVLISRGTMTELMQLSYKFFALLRTMYVTKE